MHRIHFRPLLQPKKLERSASAFRLQAEKAAKPPVQPPFGTSSRRGCKVRIAFVVSHERSIALARMRSWSGSLCTNARSTGRSANRTSAIWRRPFCRSSGCGQKRVDEPRQVCRWRESTVHGRPRRRARSSQRVPSSELPPTPPPLRPGSLQFSADPPPPICLSRPRKH